MEKTTESVKTPFDSGMEKDVAVLEEGRVSSTNKKKKRISNLFDWGVEARGLSDNYSTGSFSQHSTGISPIPLDKRVNRPYSKIFFIWFSMNFNILSYVFLSIIISVDH